MITSTLDLVVRPAAKLLQRDFMSAVGIANGMRLAHAYSRLKYAGHDRWRRAMYRDHFDELLEDNGPPTRPRIEMNDGWAIDTSMSLPHLDRVLEDADTIIAERCGVRQSAQGAYRSFFQNVWTPPDADRFGSILDFATSSDVVGAVADYLQCIPALSTTLPPGIRFVESNAAYDDRPDNPHDSQLYHIDFYSLPNVYVLVVLQDVTPEHGPWIFLPRSVSQRAAAELKYWSRGRPYRLSDDDVYAVVDRKEVIELCYPRGTVLFIESSGCFHYGSRNAVRPRYQLMLGYTGACRTDFAEAILKPQVYPSREGDSRLRKMVLDKYMRRSADVGA